jgi:hypothetical protein
VSAAAVAVALSGCSNSPSRTTGSTGPATATASRTASATPTSNVPAGPTLLVIHDRADDVLRSLNEGDDSRKQVAYPVADLRDVTISYRQGRVQVTERIGRLRAGHSHFPTWQLGLRGPHSTYVSNAAAPRGPVGSRAALFVDLEQLHGDSSSSVSCPAASGRADFGRNLVTFVVPSTCLGTPPWVRLTMSNTLYEGGDEEYYDYLDDSEVKRDHYTARVYSD